MHLVISKVLDNGFEGNLIFLAADQQHQGQKQ